MCALKLMKSVLLGVFENTYPLGWASLRMFVLIFALSSKHLAIALMYECFNERTRVSI